MSALRLFRVIGASVQLTNTDGHYSYVADVPACFVWGADARDDEQRAVRLITASASLRDVYRTRGTVVEVAASDALGEPIGEPRPWDDIGDEGER